ncbi:MAG: peptidylprolyl isomerase [Robiginitalea sp.]|nr:peptidylprolyl isomerase [Robiginitalea sp.]
MRKPLLLWVLATALLASCKSNYKDLGDGLYAEMKTTKGDMIIRLEQEKTPVTVANFVSLAEGNNPYVSDPYKGKPYYDGLIFHRVIPDFMIQGGDPTGTGSGNPGYRFKDEIDPTLGHGGKGILSMANSGPKTNGSQFFITHKETPWLNGRHTVFGQVVVGMDVIDSIALVPTGPQDRPQDSVVMEEVKIVRRGKAAKDFDAVQVLSDYFAEEAALEAKIREFGRELTSLKETATALPSGLKYIVLKEGDGPKPSLGQNISVHYAGWLEDGSIVDTSRDSIARASGKYEQLLALHRGDFSPITMAYSPDMGLIAGFKEALMQMKAGDKWRVFIPPHLGYGNQGSGPVPPNANLVFDLEMLPLSQ